MNEQLFIRNAKRTSLGIANAANLTASSAYWSKGMMTIVISEDVILKSFNIRQTSINPNDSVTIIINGPVNYELPLKVEFDSLLKVEHPIRLPKGEYQFSTDKTIQTTGLFVVMGYFDDIVQIDNTNAALFMNNMEFEKIEFFCLPTSFPIKTDPKCDIISSINEIYSNLEVYPNPTNGIINFNEVVSEGQIFNLQGRLVFEFTDKNRIDISNIYQGTYILKTGRKNTKIILTK
jgi:hypothetical protein